MGNLFVSWLSNIELPNFDVITENKLFFDKWVLHHWHISWVSLTSSSSNHVLPYLNLGIVLVLG
jgi:hypothetical protein